MISHSDFLPPRPHYIEVLIASQPHHRIGAYAPLEVLLLREACEADDHLAVRAGVTRHAGDVADMMTSSVDQCKRWQQLDRLDWFHRRRPGSLMPHRILAPNNRTNSRVGFRVPRLFYIV
eukprot:gene13865-biopygen4447